MDGDRRRFSFLTCLANGVVGPVHPKAMPVLLTSVEERAIWLEAPADDALKLQRPLPDDMMKEVARSARSDDAGQCARSNARCATVPGRTLLSECQQIPGNCDILEQVMICGSSQAARWPPNGGYP